jgi:hypothetical protein
MKLFTKRNAMLGWATWRFAKGIAKWHGAKNALPSRSRRPSRKKPALIAGAAAAAVAVAATVTRKKKRNGGETPPSE